MEFYRANGDVAPNFRVLYRIINENTILKDSVTGAPVTVPFSTIVYGINEPTLIDKVNYKTEQSLINVGYTKMTYRSEYDTDANRKLAIETLIADLGGTFAGYKSWPYSLSGAQSELAPESFTMTSTSTVVTEVEVKLFAEISSGNAASIGVTPRGAHTGLYWYQAYNGGDGATVGSAGGRTVLTGSPSLFSVSSFYKYRVESTVSRDTVTVWDESGTLIRQIINLQRDGNSIRSGDTVTPSVNSWAGLGLSYKNFSYSFIP